MTTTRDFTVIEGDTYKLVAPVTDGDDPNTDFYPGIANLDKEFTLVDDTGTEQIATADVTIDTVEFQNVKMEASQFDAIDNIPDSQDVITIQIPATETGSLVPGVEHSYQVRVEDTSPTPTEKFTPLRGTVTVEAEDF